MARQMTQGDKERAARLEEMKKARAEERAKQIAAGRELESVRQYIRKNVSFLPLDTYLKTNPALHRDITDGVYATITLTGADSDTVSALENLARDALRNNCSFVNVNNTVVVQQRMKKEILHRSVPEDVYHTVFVPPEITYFATGFYRKKPKSK